MDSTKLEKLRNNFQDMNTVECCSICIDMCEKGCIVTPCHHIFHKECYKSWKKHSLLSSDYVRCPNCNYTIETKHHTPNEVSPEYRDKMCCFITCLFIMGNTIFLALKFSKIA